MTKWEPIFSSFDPGLGSDQRPANVVHRSLDALILTNQGTTHSELWYSEIKEQCLPGDWLGQEWWRGQVPLQSLECGLKFLPRQESTPIFLNTWKDGLHLSMDQLWKLFRAVRHPFSICTSLTHISNFMFRVVDIWLGLAFIPHWVTIYPKNFPKDTLKVHFSGFSFTSYFQRRLNASLR